MRRKPVMHGIMELPAELYLYLCQTSFERADKLPHNDPEAIEHRARLRQLEICFRNTAWEEK